MLNAESLLGFLNDPADSSADGDAVRTLARYFGTIEGNLGCDQGALAVANEYMVAQGRVNCIVERAFKKLYPSVSPLHIGRGVGFMKRWNNPPVVFCETRKASLSDAEWAGVRLFLALMDFTAERDLKGSAWEPRLKTCTACGAFFLDRSPNNRGRTCSGNCRMKRMRQSHKE